MINIELLHKNFKPKVEKFLPELEKRGIFITSGYRTAKEQNALYKKGGITSFDGYKKKSQHQYGKAIDIAFSDDPRTTQTENKLYPEDFKKWREIADIAKGFGIDWGYDLWKWDKPHFQDNGIDFNNYIKKMLYQEQIEDDYTPLSPARMKMIVKGWAATGIGDEELAFNEGKTIKTQPKTYKDLKDSIVIGRLVLMIKKLTNGKL